MANKHGKPITFIKGMQSDMDEAAQPKESYRYAKNIRLSGYESVTPSSNNGFVNAKETSGSNTLSLQPYPSDRIALNLSQWVSRANTQSLSFSGVWGDDIDILNDVNIDNWINATITITLVIQDVGDVVQTFSIDTSTIQNVWNGTTDTNALIASIINNNPDHSIHCWIRHFNYNNDYNGIPNEEGNDTNEVWETDLGTENDFANYYFSNQNNPENFVTNILVDVSGTIYDADADEEIEYQQTLIDEITDTSLPQLNVEILGQHSFSDYMVLLGRFGTIDSNILEDMGATEDEIAEGVWPADLPGPDVVIKVKQDTDGQLYAVNDAGEIVVNENFSFYYQGKLGFSEKQQLKVVGSEENEKSRRIYFTDTTFPLRTMNVAKDASFYAPYFNSPEFFNIFSEAKFSSVEITGFEDGGSLKNRSYSYGYQYISGDGRISGTSTFSNPCAVPLTPKSQINNLYKGGPSSTESSKSITGRMDSLDTRYNKVRMIAVEYTSGNATGAAYFGEFPIEQDGTCTWIHTGFESVLEDPSTVLNEIILSGKPWDLCKSLEVKDNRLFVGNITESLIEIDTDFSLYSYNANNEPHPLPAQNPHICEPALYDDVFLESTNNELTSDYYRYIKGPGNVSEGDETEGSFGDAFFEPQEVPFGYSSVLGGHNKGIYGAQSENFSTPIQEGVGIGEYEGVRVTFRMLDKCPDHMSTKDLINNTMALSLDTKGIPVELNPNDIRTPGVGGEALGGYLKNYANPIYNSHFLGYRRGEVYRFGILFFDKKGSPMFVQRIGDVRMPNHSTAYLMPTYTESHTDNNGTGIDGFIQPWPFYYQTSRDKADAGMNYAASFDNNGGYITNNATIPALNGDNEDLDNILDETDAQSYSGGNVDKLHGFSLFPYFEVKLSTNTRNSIGGYSIVRVKREEEFKSVLTSGVINRCELYGESEGGTGDFNNWDDYMSRVKKTLYAPSMPLWTMQNQEATWEGDPNRFGAVNEEDASVGYGVYMIDSPDVILNEYEINNIQGNHRLEIIESAFCMRGDEKTSGYSVDNDGNVNETSCIFDVCDNWGFNFGGLLSQSILDGDGGYINTDGEEVSSDAWESSFSASDDDDGTGQQGDYMQWTFGNFSGLFDNVELEGNYTSGNNISPGREHFGMAVKYYSKRHPAYPQRLFVKNFQNVQAEWPLDGDGMGVKYSIMEPQAAFQGDRFRTRINNEIDENYFNALYINDDWNTGDMEWTSTGWGAGCFTPYIRSMKILGTTSGNDSWDDVQNEYANDKGVRNFLVEWPIGIAPGNRNDFMGGGLKSNGTRYIGVETQERHSKTLAIELAHTGYLPIIRGWATNSQEDYHAGVGNWPNWVGKDSTTFSPEVSIVNIVKNVSVNTLYGGTTLKQFARNNWVYTGHYRHIEDGPGPIINTGRTDNNFYIQNNFIEVDGIQYGKSQNFDANGHPDSIFGGDTYVNYFHHRKTSHTTDLSKDDDDDNDNAFCMGYSVPIESNFNIDLRPENFWMSYNSDIPSQIHDDYGVNKSYFAHNKVKVPQGKTDDEEFQPVKHFPEQVRWSEIKHAGDTIDNYSVFPELNQKDLDFTKGPITQMFELQNKLYALQHSGVAYLNVNPKAILNTEEGKSIVTFAGSDAVLEDIDYVSDSYGSQHFFGRAITETNAYYYDSDKCKLLRLGAKGGKGRDAASTSVESLGESKGMQNYFQSFKNLKINDKPLFHNSLIPGSNNGGISMGYDPEYGEVLITIKPEERNATTIVYNEQMSGFTTFLSKRASFYFNHKGRMYSVYDSVETEFEGVDMEEAIQAGAMPYYQLPSKTKLKFRDTLSTIDAPNPEVSNKLRYRLEVAAQAKTIKNDLGIKTKNTKPELIIKPNKPIDLPPTISYMPFQNGYVGEDLAGGDGGDDGPVDPMEVVPWTPVTPEQEAEFYDDLQIFEHRGLEKVWLSNGFKFLGIEASDNPDEQLYLNFGGVDYYYSEPLEVEVILNDDPMFSKIFDNMALGMQTESNVTPNIFTKFVFRGDSDDFEHMQASNVDENWYKIREGIHFVPTRQDGIATKVRGRYASARMIMQIGEGNQGSFLTQEYKSFNFNLLSVLYKYRLSKI